MLAAGLFARSSPAACGMLGPGRAVDPCSSSAEVSRPATARGGSWTLTPAVLLVPGFAPALFPCPSPSMYSPPSRTTIVADRDIASRTGQRHRFRGVLFAAWSWRLLLTAGLLPASQAACAAVGTTVRPRGDAILDSLRSTVKNGTYDLYSYDLIFLKVKLYVLYARVRASQAETGRVYNGLDLMLCMGLPLHRTDVVIKIKKHLIRA